MIMSDEYDTTSQSSASTRIETKFALKSRAMLQHEKIYGYIQACILSSVYLRLIILRCCGFRSDDCRNIIKARIGEIESKGCGGQETALSHVHSCYRSKSL